MKSAIACSGSSHATSSTKFPSPFSTASRTIFSARSFMSSSSALMARGVKPRLMIWRIRVCSGASWLMIITRWSSTWSRSIPSLKRMIAPFSMELKLLLSLETAETSACLLTAQ